MLTSLVLGGLHQRSGVALPTGGRADPAVGNEALAGTRRSFFLSLVPGARWYPTLKPTQFSTLKPTRRSLAPYTETKTIFPHCTKIKNFFIVVLIPKPFLKFPDELIGKGCPTTGVLSTYRGHHIPWRKKKGKKKKVPGSYYVLYEHQRRRQLAARGHCHSSTAISARRPAAEVKLLLRVYLTRQVVGHRVAQATALPSGGGAEAPFGVVAVADQVL